MIEIDFSSLLFSAFSLLNQSWSWLGKKWPDYDKDHDYCTFFVFFFHSLLPSYPSPYYELEGPVGWTFARVMLKGKHSAYIPLSPALSPVLNSKKKQTTGLRGRGTRDLFASLWKIRKKLRDCEVEMLFFNIITFTSQSLNFLHCRHSWSMKMWTPLHTSYYFPLLHYFLLHLRICQH